jgi:hypothetical protein
MTATTVWELAAATGQPLEVVIFQAVAYGAWNEGGRIDAEWAAALSGVLSGSHPWKRVVGHDTGTSGDTAATDVEVGAGDEADPVALDGTEGSPTATFAAAVLANLGQPVPVADATLAERLAAAGLGEISAEGFSGYAEEAPALSQLAHGSLNLAELEPK